MVRLASVAQKNGSKQVVRGEFGLNRGHIVTIGVVAQYTSAAELVVVGTALLQRSVLFDGMVPELPGAIDS